jgi:hypothetical protein
VSAPTNILDDESTVLLDLTILKIGLSAGMRLKKSLSG